MRIHAGTLASLLQADLERAGWNGAKSSYPGQTVRQKSLAALDRSLLKKYLMGTTDTSPDADAAALSLFMKVNEACRLFVYDTAGLPDWVRIALGEAKTFIWDFFYPADRARDSWHDQDFILSLHEICKGLDTGPGSSIGSPNTDKYSKFALSDLSASSSALHMLYVQAIRSNPTWSSCENVRGERLGYRIAKSSRLSFVPKYTDISRTICTEPVLNMFFQKGIGAVIERRLRQVLNIDLTKQQPINQRFAQHGSSTGEFGTIDLSSASDSLSLTIVREFFPPDVVRWLERTRTATTILPDGSELELHMISSMGNAFTFPLQTLFFAALVYGAYRARGLPLIRSRTHSLNGINHCDTYGAPSLRAKSIGNIVLGNFAVNGDDIIVVSKAYDLVCELLTITGFSVNIDKSFNEGLFRESCGRDYYCGVDVRGVYLKRLRDACDCYSAINRLNRWSAKHQVALPSLVGYLKSKVRYLPIPFDEDDSSGIKVPLMLLKHVSRHPDTGGIFYRFVKLNALTIRVDLPLNEQPKVRGWYFNPDGLMLALLAGSIRDGRIGLRVNTRSAKTRRRYSSHWDYIPFDQVERPGFAEGWKYFCELNLNNGSTYHSELY